MEVRDIEQLSVLLVEPSPTQAKVINASMRDLGLEQVVISHDGQKALQLLGERPVDLVISAMYMPDMTGIDLIETIRHHPVHGDTAFMLISSETAFSMLDPVRQAGVVAILPKPFSAEQLHQAMQSTLELVRPEITSLEEATFFDLEVLLVDDSALARKHMRRVLASMGITHVTEAEDGSDAIDIMQNERFDLIVTDYNMPEVDGDRLVKYIRGESAQPDVPVLMVTSEQNQSRLAAVQNSGVSSICDKPFDPTHVRRMIYDVLAHV